MNGILSTLRKAVEEFSMITDGDRIAVGVSGGKDSVALLYFLAKLSEFYPKKFEIVGITLDMQFGGANRNFEEIKKFADSLGLEYHVEKTDIAEVIFDIRKEKNPCSLCARMRRGALHDMAKKLGCNKIALGHHKDDALETVLMNLFDEGRFGCFSPVTYLSRKNLTMIRPLVFTDEKDIRAAVKKLNLPVVKSICPADGLTNRQSKKQFIEEQERQNHGFKKRLFGALRKSGVDGWGFS